MIAEVASHQIVLVTQPCRLLIAGSQEQSGAFYGPGIAREELTLLFNRYQQTHSPIPQSRNEHSISQGHGLGLAIVRRIAALHGSLPTLDTAPGKGLRIGFSMPSVEM